MSSSEESQSAADVEWLTEIDELTADERLAQKSLASECNKKEWAFVREYIVDLNGTQAVWRAGCFRVKDDASAAVCASMLLRRPKVKAALAVVTAQRNARVSMTADSVLSEMAALANSDISHYYVDDDGKIRLTEEAPANAMSAIQSVKHRKTIKEDKDGNVFITHDVEIRLWDKPAPLRLMGKHIGLFPDRMEHTGKDGGPIQTTRRIIDPAKEGGPAE